MHRVLILMISCLLLLSCTQKLICPAYQSAFIHDKEALRKKYSYFNEDSTPKIVSANTKNRYLFIDKVSNRKKTQRLRTVEMKEVHPELPDSAKGPVAYTWGGFDPTSYGKPLPWVKVKEEKKVEGAEQDPNDTTKLKKPEEPEDSVYTISKDRETRVLKYYRDSAKHYYYIEHVTMNADQDNYMWYFRDVLVLPDVRAALEDQKDGKNATNAKGAAADKKKKGGFFGFFKNLFKKKPKADSTASKLVAPPPLDSDNPADSTASLDPVPPQGKATNGKISGTPATVTPATPEPEKKKKKGIFGMFKKDKKKEEAKPPEPPKDPAKKDDGF